MSLPELGWQAILTFTAIGALGGIIAGLFGVGGGSVFGPLLLLTFEQQGIPPDMAVVAAISTSIAAVLLTSLPSTTVHALHRNVRWKSVTVIAPAALVGAALGAQIAQIVSPFLLVVAMLTILLSSARNLLTRQKRKKDALTAKPTARVRFMQAGLGSFAGITGAITGTGGGILISPLLYRMGVPLRECIGTSAAITIVVAVSSSLSYFGHGVHVPALGMLSVTCVLCAGLGARLANILPVDKLRIMFATFLLLVCARIAYWLVQTVALYT